MADPAVLRLRRHAREIFAAGVAAADPVTAVRRGLRLAASGRPLLAGQELAPGARLRVVAFGKAACAMAEGAGELLPGEVFPEAGIVVVDRENRRPVDRFRVLAGGHPLPDSAGLEAGRQVVRYLEGARPGDGLLVLISGGGSALLTVPAPGIALQDKQETTRRLLACGASIHEINAVRKHLSASKGGGLARLGSPARIEALILSDVIGDDLGTVASGPTAPDPSTFREVRAILERRGLFATLPDAVRRRIVAGERGALPETPKPGDPLFRRVANRLVGSNGLSLDAAAARGLDLGYATTVISRRLAGEAREVGEAFAGRLGQAAKPGARALLAGGETTVTLRASGKGGRNQELALAFALVAEATPGDAPWVFLSAGTDGRDGPTDAAGGMVDPGTTGRIRAAGIDPRDRLAHNDSYHALDAAGDLLVTGATGTNVADLQVLLIGPRNSPTPRRPRPRTSRSKS